MLKIVYTNRMKHDARLMKKRGKDMDKLSAAIDILAAQKEVPSAYHDHQLTGKWKIFRECHIEPDWLLVYRIFEDELVFPLPRIFLCAQLQSN
jgi:mRNA interferase YafQ